jgi:hypothetical protein
MPMYLPTTELTSAAALLLLFGLLSWVAPPQRTMKSTHSPAPVPSPLPLPIASSTRPCLQALACPDHSPSGTASTTPSPPDGGCMWGRGEIIAGRVYGLAVEHTRTHTHTHTHTHTRTHRPWPPLPPRPEQRPVPIPLRRHLPQRLHLHLWRASSRHIGLYAAPQTPDIPRWRRHADADVCVRREGQRGVGACRCEQEARGAIPRGSADQCPGRHPRRGNAARRPRAAGGGVALKGRTREAAGE